MTEQNFGKSRDERAKVTEQDIIKSRDEKERAIMTEQEFIKSRDEREIKG